MPDNNEAVVLTKNQEEMLYFLTPATEEFPLDLAYGGFDLGQRRHRTTLYREALQLIHMRFVKEKHIKGQKPKHWITPEGKAALRALHSERRTEK